MASASVILNLIRFTSDGIMNEMSFLVLRDLVSYWEVKIVYLGWHLSFLGNFDIRSETMI